MHARDGVLTPDSPDELRDRARVRDLPDDPKQCSLFVGLLLVRRAQQLADAETVLLREDHFQDGRFRDPRGVQRLNEQMGGIVAVTGQRPRNTGDDLRAALDEPADELGEGFLADESCQHFDESDGGRLAGIRQGGKYRFDGAWPQVLEPRHSFLQDGTGLVGG